MTLAVGFGRERASAAAAAAASLAAGFDAAQRSFDAGRPVEQPSIVACRYARRCR
jgi:Glucodextranase, domain N